MEESMSQNSMSRSKPRTHYFKLAVIATVALGFVSVATQEAKAVSSAAALYLRLAAGARAAAMGEAYVAVADDATSTHWNPAGLGAAPMSAVWNEASIPREYRPISKFVTIVRNRAAVGFEAYEVWAMSKKGLVRFDGETWTSSRLYEASPDERIRSIVSRYLQTSDDDRVQEAIQRVSEANNPFPVDDITAFEEEALAAIPDDDPQREEIANWFVTLKKNYDLLLVHWKRFTETRDRFRKDNSDSELTERELDRLNVGLERSLRRYLPLMVKLPYDMNFSGELTDIASVGRKLWVGSTAGLYSFDGRNWVTFKVTEAAEGGANTGNSTVPSNTILSLFSDGKRLFVGTDRGLVEHFGIGWQTSGSDEPLPEGKVTGISVDENKTVWAVVDDDIYRLDNNRWKNYTEFTVSIDESPAQIAENFAIYKTEAEQAIYLKRLKELNPELVGADGVLKLNLGAVIKAPIVAEIKGDITSVLAHSGRLWVGTNDGLLSYDGKGWKRFGYREFLAPRDMTVTEIALEAARNDSARALAIAEQIREQNDLESDNIGEGERVWIARNVASSRINDIAFADGNVHIATERGAIVFDGQKLGRFSQEGLNKQATIGVTQAGESLWYATGSRVVFLDQPKRHATLMHAKWLPQLADDLAYNFVSYAQSIKGAGTFGLSLSFFDYGSVQRTDSDGNANGTEAPADFAFALSYGTPLSDKTAVGATVKLLVSNLTQQGAGLEIGDGKATGFAVDAGIKHRFHDRFTFGAALTNLGPRLTYIDAQQADPLPLNIAVGVAWKAFRSESMSLLLATDVNNVIVEESLEPIYNFGGELTYANFIAFRFGRIHDNAGDIKAWTFGAGLRLQIPGIGLMPVDLAYIPSSDDLALANTLRTSISMEF
jgi:ligand-binding sensor domain-containing protein